MSKFTFPVPVILLFFCLQPASAYETADSSSYSFLPSLGYTSDLGFAGGGSVNRIVNSSNYQPYKSFTDFSALVSTNGYVSGRLSYDKPNIFDTNARSKIEFNASRRLNDNYFGIGNSSGFDNNLWDDNFYNFESISLETSVRTRHPLYRNEDNRLDMLSLGGISYNIPYDRNSERLIGQDRPTGFAGGWVNYIGTGIMWETRDDEFAPTRGGQSRLEIYLMPELLFSDFQMAVIYAEARRYINVEFLSNTVVALRGGFEHAVGDVPYWQLPYIGGENTVRGYPFARFRGSSALFYNAELRNWLFADELYDFRAGAHIFSDAGRVFNDQDDWSEVLNHHKRTYGFGLAFAPFDASLIIRTDYAFSSDMRRLYISFGYLF